jgi:serine phosphatase RsbU (regulator of sigma subunit)
MLMTDGIVEAQDAAGQLFGFERIGNLLGDGKSGGAALAAAAQAFGQEDDITVLTIQFVPERVNSAALSKPATHPA